MNATQTAILTTAGADTNALVLGLTVLAIPIGIGIWVLRIGPVAAWKWIRGFAGF